MTISELMSLLNEYRQLHGDVDVYTIMGPQPILRISVEYRDWLNRQTGEKEEGVIIE